MTIGEAYSIIVESLNGKYPPEEAKSIAKIVVEDFLKSSMARFEEQLDISRLAGFENLFLRLKSGEPLQYVLGEAHFFGRKFKVNPDVLIPRPETEELVHWVIETIKANTISESLRILDIGTGSGCIPITIKLRFQHADVHACDISGRALRVAAANSAALGGDVHYFQMDVLDVTGWSTLPRFDIIVSNPPYIPFRERNLLSQNVVDFEPHVALFVSDDDSLIFYRKIAELALAKLSTAGLLFFECNEFNAAEVQALLFDAGFTKVQLRKDIFRKERMVCALK
jgi:release factor glutamine methyltransferase